MADHVWPKVRLIHACDSADESADGKWVIKHPWPAAVMLPAGTVFPFRLRGLRVYVQLTEGVGEFDVRVELLRVRDDVTRISIGTGPPGRIEFLGGIPFETVDRAFRLKSAPFWAEGVYELRVVADAGEDSFHALEGFDVSIPRPRIRRLFVTANHRDRDDEGQFALPTHRNSGIIEVDCSAWDSDLPAEKWSVGQFVTTGRSLPEVVGEFTPAASRYLRIVLRRSEAADANRVVELGSRLIAVLGQARPDLSLEFDGRRSHADPGLVVIALTPSNGADSFDKLAEAASECATALADDLEYRFERLEFAARDDV